MAANYWGYTIPLHIPRAPGDCLIQVFCDENSPGTKDNFAQIYAEVNGTFAFDPDSKAYASRTALATMIMGTGSGAALSMAGVAASSPPGMALVAIGVTFGVLTGILGKISNDPPDFNYAETFDPQFGFPPILTKGGFISRWTANALNYCLDRLFKCYAYATAATVANDKAQGARLSGDGFWESVQLDRARNFRAELAANLADFNANLSVAINGLKNHPIDTQPTISGGLLREFQNEQDPGTQATYGQLMFADMMQNPNHAARVFVDNFLDRLLCSDEDRALILREFCNPRWPWQQFPQESPTIDAMPNPARFGGAYWPNSLTTRFPDFISALWGHDGPILADLISRV